MEQYINTSSLILASSSSYRKELLQRLGLEFSTISPDIDESPVSTESPQELVLRLAADKARKVANDCPGGLIIASDQVLSIDDIILGKPGNFETGKKQLQQVSGRQVTFFTSLCLLNTISGQQQLDVVPVHVTFRDLTANEIERYLENEKPYDCAGSFKSERMGVSLMEKMTTDDPTALIGLPLIRLCEMLRQEGVNLP